LLAGWLAGWLGLLARSIVWLVDENIYIAGTKKIENDNVLPASQAASQSASQLAS